MKMSETEWARIEHKKLIQQMENYARKMLARLRGDWEPAPPDPGIVPGGIRDRAIKGIRK
jgi:hypothetical protein